MGAKRILGKAWMACAVALTAILGSQASAQFTGNNQTNTISGVTSNWTGDYYVGSNFVFDALLIQNGGVLSNANGFIGYAVGANSNVVIVSGDGSAWHTEFGLSVGYSGAANSLVISNGGKVDDGLGCNIGYNAGASNNSVRVTGSGSVWSNKNNLFVGWYGAGNSLVISDGAAVINPACTIGVNSSASHNSVLVTGPGTVWNNNGATNYGALVVGGDSSGNSLVISNGAAVFSFFGAVGAPSANNSVRVADNGSWMISSGLNVGSSFGGGTSNVLTIAGGSVLATNATISGFAPDSNNVIQVDSGSLFLTNALGNAKLVVSRAGGKGALILNGGSVTVDSLIATNGANSVVQFNGGLLNSKGTAVSNAQQFAVGNGAASANFHLLGGVHSFNNGLRIRSNSFLTGCGTITGTVVVDAGGSVVADCPAGAGLTFTGSLTNNGILHAENGSVLEAYGPVVNNGIIDLMDGTTNFHSTFINNGTIVNASYFRVVSISQEGNNMRITWPSVGGRNYVVEVADDLGIGFTDLSPAIVIPGTSLSTTNYLDLGGATNAPSRFYRVRLVP